jgi:hypothetical protein
MTMAAFDAQVQSDESANTPRPDDTRGPEHMPALLTGAWAPRTHLRL